MTATQARRVGFCFDLSGTLTTTPIQTMVASAVDLVEEIDVLTRATERGDLPFARSIRLQCRVLDEVPVSEALPACRSRRSMPTSPRSWPRRRDARHVLTTLPDCWVTALGDRLAGEMVASTAEVVDDRLVAVTEVVDKAAIAERLHEHYDLVVAVGSGAGDLGMLEAADVAVAFGRHPASVVQDAADYWVTSGRALWQLLRPL